MKRPWSVRTHLGLLVLAVAVPLAAVLVYVIRSEMGVVERRAEDTVAGLAEATAGNVTRFLDEAEGMLAALARRHELHNLDPQACRHAVQDLRNLIPQAANAFLAVDGRPFCSALPAPDSLHAGEHEWWTRVSEEQVFTVGLPRMGRISNTWVSILAYPVRAPDGRFVGALGVALDLVRVQRLLTSAGLPPGAVITLQHDNGTVVARSEDPQDWVGRQLPSSGLSREHETQRAGVSRVSGAEGVERLWAYVNIPLADWRVYTGVSTDWVYTPVRAQAVRLGLAALAMVGLSILLAGAFYRRVDRSLDHLVRGTRAAALGDPAPIPLEGPREIVQVADQFNLMLDARAQAEAHVRHAEARFRSILEHAAFGIYLADARGRFLEVNPALVAMLGFADRDELMALDATHVYENPADLASLVEACTEAGETHRWEVGWRRRDGTRISVRLTGSAFRESGDGEMVYEVIAEDVTQHRALEAQFRQAQKMQAIGRLAGGVAHDFNNLLTVINGEARFLLEDLPQRHAMRGSAEEILASGERAAALTRQLLAFSRKQVSRPVPTDLNQVIENLEKMLRRLIGERVEFEVRLSASPGPVMADPGQLEQVLMNLVLNARDAMPQGGTLTVSTRYATLDAKQATRSYPGLAPGSYALLTVSDTGAGMTDDVQLRIFEPFFTTKPEGKGTGLGLSTVYGIVTQAGGHISVQSQLGRGSAFTVLFRLITDMEDAPAAPAAEQPPRSERPTVLVVEDERSVRDMVCRVLDRGGYAVVSAENGQEALDRAQGFEGPIDLVLTDVRMPLMNGHEMAQQMQSIRPDARILFMSGYVDDALIPVEVRDDPETFIPKPFSPGELLEQVSQLLSTARGG